MSQGNNFRETTGVTHFRQNAYINRTFSFPGRPQDSVELPPVSSRSSPKASKEGSAVHAATISPLNALPGANAVRYKRGLTYFSNKHLTQRRCWSLTDEAVFWKVLSAALTGSNPRPLSRTPGPSAPGLLLPGARLPRASSPALQPGPVPPHQAGGRRGSDAT